jgi:hypothetical protein
MLSLCVCVVYRWWRGIKLNLTIRKHMRHVQRIKMAFIIFRRKKEVKIRRLAASLIVVMHYVIITKYV